MAQRERTLISLLELFRMFPDHESARAYFEARRWPNGVCCPVCGLTERITVRKGGYYRCKQCKEDFTVRTGTIFKRSHVPLHKWLYAMYLLVTSRKGISSVQLSKEIDITQKTAWFMLQRLREACGNDPTVLAGIVEATRPTSAGARRTAMSRSDGNVTRRTLARLDSLIGAAIGRRLTYAELIA